MSMTADAADPTAGGGAQNGRPDNLLLELVRKIALASVGAVVVAQEEVETFINKLIERGEIAERDGRTLISDLVEKRKQATQKTIDQAGTQVDSTIERVLHRVNIPTKGDIEELTRKIDAMNRRLDEFSAGR